MSTSTHPFDMIITGAEVFLQKPGTEVGRLEKAAIAIKDGKIAAINPNNAQATQIIDMSGLTIFPGWIDSQVHFREPGLEQKEDLAHGSAAAAQGGITAFSKCRIQNPILVTKHKLKTKWLVRAKKAMSTLLSMPVQMATILLS